MSTTKRFHDFLLIFSGQRSELKIIDDTLSFTLGDNNTLIIGAKLFARVAAKTWIWKGINFGLLGCLKMTSCGGDVVTYRANIDMRLSIQVLWDQQSEKMAIKIKPVETDIHDVNVDVTFSLLIFFKNMLRDSTDLFCSCSFLHLFFKIDNFSK